MRGGIRKTIAPKTGKKIKRNGGDLSRGIVPISELGGTLVTTCTSRKEISLLIATFLCS